MKSVRVPFLHRHLLPLTFFAVFALSAQFGFSQKKIDFNRDIRSILSNNCFKCHGPDETERQADLRLDIKLKGLKELEDGGLLIVPGHSAKSELYKRIANKDQDEKMPPVDSGKHLTKEQIALIKAWIDQGAVWKEHWAFRRPVRPKLPKIKTEHEKNVRNPIDRFIIARLEKEGLKPAIESNKESLIRKVTFDLSGLPPTIEQIDAFLKDNSPGAYEKVVDRLLKSPQYGEHMTRYWLDAARYGDTHGLHLDNVRSLWPYRDWVIKAFNDNMPFDQFTVEQLAGDLLPNPTLEQRIATGFNRCNVSTSEGGSIAAEYLVRYAVDRVETTSTVWMGLTMGCAVCHDHKFDPLSQKEFYQLFAYYYSLNERAMDGNALLPPPTVRVPSAEQKTQQQMYQDRIATLKQDITTKVASIHYVDPFAGKTRPATKRDEFVWIDDAIPKGAKPSANGTGSGKWEFVSKKQHPVYSGKKSSTRTSKGLSQHYFQGAPKGLRVGEGDVFFAYVYLDPKNPPKEIMLQFNDGSWEHRAIWGENLINWGRLKTGSRRPLGKLPQKGKWVRLEVPVNKVGLKPGSIVNGWAFTQFDGTVYWDKAGIVTKTPQDGSDFNSLLAWEQIQKEAKKPSIPKNIDNAIKVAKEKRTKAQQKIIRDYFVENVYSEGKKILAPLRNEINKVNKQLADLNKKIPGTMVMEDLKKHRDTYVLVRGEYDKPDKKQKVEPGVPAIFPPLPKNAPPNRLALAKWLVRDDHPLTARVIVNRYWQHYFGTGIVKTSEDFGSQGDWPSHPKLLDWLATEFLKTGWDVKKMQKLIVMSGTYRQSSKVDPLKNRKDPQNRLLSRGPRFRLDAEMIRDNALFVSGLLVEKIGGPSVKTYQPEGLWRAVGYTDSNTAKFKQDKGEKLFRRSMYTFWKRTSPPPSMSTFDAPSRESCTVRRERTNTPLQALTLLNDVQFVEAARHFAARIMKDGGKTAEDKIIFAFRSATGRKPTAAEIAVVLDVYETHRQHFQNHQKEAKKLLSIGDTKLDKKLGLVEHAAWTMVANLLLNLDETITKG